MTRAGPPAHRARKRFGQHFLSDEAVVDRIVQVLRLQPRDTVLEIGPGQGVLTEFLLDRAGAVRTIEIDRDLAAALEPRFPGLEVVQGDVLKLSLEDLMTTPTRVVGNLPYNITSPLLGRLFAARSRIVDMHFMLQREVVARLAAVPGTADWGRLGVYAQYLCQVDPLFEVPPSSFSPPPKVHSAFVRLVPRASTLTADPTHLQRVLKVAFGQRRKRLGNALRSLDLDWDMLAVDPDLRPQDVDLEGYVAMAAALAARERAAS